VTRRRNVACALGALGTIALACPTDPLAHPEELEARGRTVEAGEAYLEVAQRDPALLAAWDGAIRNFCRIRHDVGRCLAALDDELDLLGRVDRHAAALAEALESRARARLEKGLVDAARSDLERAEQVTPERASLQTAQARVHLAVGEHEEAQARLRKARDLDPSLPEIETLWALAHVTETATATPDRGSGPSEPDLPAFGR